MEMAFQIAMTFVLESQTKHTAALLSPLEALLSQALEDNTASVGVLVHTDVLTANNSCLMLQKFRF
jgi:hypothetical protein